MISESVEHNGIFGFVEFTVSLQRYIYHYLKEAYRESKICYRVYSVNCTYILYFNIRFVETLWVCNVRVFYSHSRVVISRSRSVATGFSALFNFYFQESVLSLTSLRNGKTSFLYASDSKMIWSNHACVYRRCHLADILPYYLPQIADRRDSSVH